MKKYIIFLFIFLISCAGDSENSNVILEIEPDTNEGETSESQNSTDDNVLEYPADFDIDLFSNQTIEEFNNVVNFVKNNDEVNAISNILSKLKDNSLGKQIKFENEKLSRDGGN